MNREEMERVEPQIQQLRKQLLKEQGLYDRSIVQFESLFDDVMEDIHIYENLVETGTYSEASEIVEKIKEKMSGIEQSMQEFPDLYKKCKFELPSKLDDVYKNVREMESQGYYLEHLHTKKSINDFQARLLDYVAALEKTETEKVKNLIPET